MSEFFLEVKAPFIQFQGENVNAEASLWAAT